MRKEYDFTKSRKNPYAKQLKRQVTIRLDTMAVRDCALQKRRPNIQWENTAAKGRLGKGQNLIELLGATQIRCILWRPGQWSKLPSKLRIDRTP